MPLMAGRHRTVHLAVAESQGGWGHGYGAFVCAKPAAIRGGHGGPKTLNSSKPMPIDVMLRTMSEAQPITSQANIFNGNGSFASLSIMRAL
jgi:hypothetical protein